MELDGGTQAHLGRHETPSVIAVNFPMPAMPPARAIVIGDAGPFRPAFGG
jgi:hypothetical protein